VNAKTLKLMAAGAGGAAVIAMGGLTMATTSWAEPETPTPGPVPTEEATTGETTTLMTPPPTTPTTSSVAPEIEGPAPLPPEQEDLVG
jgi:hypothetical protein